MLGAIIGDVIGSRFEWGSYKTKSFELFASNCAPTDDSIMTVAVGLACANAGVEDKERFQRELIKQMRRLGRLYPDAGYGSSFDQWIHDDAMGPYNSLGNGSAMRVSPVAWAAKTLQQAEELAEWSAAVTHNHPEGILGAQAVAAAIFLARTGKSREEIRAYLAENYYRMDFTLAEIRPDYTFDVTCRGSVPQALMCFLESVSFEDAIRNAISLGGDGDTQAAIAGSVAEAFYGIPTELEEKVFAFLDTELTDAYLFYADVLFSDE